MRVPVRNMNRPVPYAEFLRSDSPCSRVLLNHPERLRVQNRRASSGVRRRFHSSQEDRGNRRPVPQELNCEILRRRFRNLPQKITHRYARIASERDEGERQETPDAHGMSPLVRERRRARRGRIEDEGGNRRLRHHRTHPRRRREAKKVPIRIVTWTNFSPGR